MEEPKINLKLDSPYRVKVESLEEFETSLFFETYKKAAKIIQEICQTRQTIWKKTKEYTKEDVSSIVEENTYTIVPFLGNRGTGKTSAMLSFAVSFLKNYDCMQVYQENKIKEIYEKLNVKGLKARFHVLDMIDATILEAPEEIIEIVLVRMLDQLREIEEREAGRERRYREDFEKKKRYFMQSFEETIEAVYNLFHKKSVSDKMDYIPIDYLKGMRISWNLKKQIRRLITDYTKILSEFDFTEKNDNYLVIMIDDIDMNVKNCYEFLEIVRCYLMVPDVIVLLSTNYEQLHQMCQSYYRRILYRDREYVSLSDYETRRINGLANEYLEKMIPTGRKLFLPSVRSEEETTSIRIGEKDGKNLTIREEILGNIYQYTGLLYYPNGEERHFMEPKTIRKLTNYKHELSLLHSINKKKGYDLSTEDKLTLETNLNWMYHDVVNRLAVLKLDGEYLYLFREIIEQSSANRNNLIIRRLLEYFDPLKEDKKFITYLDKRAKVSYGDVLYVLEKCKDWQTQEKRLVECIIALYMVFIYKQLVLTDFGQNKDVESSIKRKINKVQSIFSLLSGANNMGFLTQYIFPDIVLQKPENRGQNEENDDVPKQKLISFTVRQENCKIKNVLDSIVEKSDNLENKIYIFQIVTMFSLFQSADIGENVSIDLLNFIPYIFEYSSYMPKVLEYLKGKIAPRNIQTSSNLQVEMDKWKEKFTTTCIIPFYSVDFMYHLSKVIHEKMQIYNGRTVSEEEIKYMFIEIFKIIGEELEELDRFYNEYERKIEIESVSYYEIYKENPFIKKLGIYEEPFSEFQEDLWKTIIFMFANQEPAKMTVQTSDNSMQE